MTQYDVHIKNGTIVDGTRVPRYRGDVWIKDGKIAQLGGRSPGEAKQVIDANGLIVAPGFVDLHTHYDAQIRWDPWCSTSGWHGVTSVVLGNCGFGFAPVKPEFRERSMLMMTRNEAIPFETMKIGMEWDWETIPEYLDSLDRAPKGVNVLHYMPTASLMIYVMGLEAAKTRPANEAERAEMRRLLHEGMDAGLCGFSIQRLGPNSGQPDYDGTPMVTDIMVDEDILNLARVLHERDEGFIQITQNTGLQAGDWMDDLRFSEKLAEASGRPVLHNAIVPPKGIDEEGLLDRAFNWFEEANARGNRVFSQGGTVRLPMNVTLADFNLFDFIPVWRDALAGNRENRLKNLKDPKHRDALRKTHGTPELEGGQEVLTGPIEDMVVVATPGHDELDGYIGKSVQQIAEEEGKNPLDAFFDLSIAGDLDVDFNCPPREYNIDNYVRVTAGSPYTFPGVSDGGAHTKFYNGGAYTTDVLKWMVRDEKKLTLEEAHYRLSTLPAHAAGFKDRGVLREGAPADIIVYDLDGLEIEPETFGEIVHDLPGGEWRRVNFARGYRAILVNGTVTFDDGECTGATPGKLLRKGSG